MILAISLILINVIGIVQSSPSMGPSRKIRTFTVGGHVTHGVNSYNSKLMVDFSGSSTIFTKLGPAHEIGVFTPKGTNASKITASTPKKALMATINPYDFQIGLDFPEGVGPFNIPIARTPTISMQSQDINDRVRPRLFSESGNFKVQGMPYLSAGADKDVSLGEWNKIAGRMTVKCYSQYAVVKIVVKRALPFGIYTMWDVGVTDALKKTEMMSASAFGGLPNVITTDEHGFGYASRKLKYCPFDKCPGSKRCTLYVSLFYHFDHMVYAGSPALDPAGPTIGGVGSNHMQFFVNAKQIIPPQNKVIPGKL